MGYVETSFGDMGMHGSADVYTRVYTRVHTPSCRYACQVYTHVCARVCTHFYTRVYTHVIAHVYTQGRVDLVMASHAMWRKWRTALERRLGPPSREDGYPNTRQNTCQNTCQNTHQNTCVYACRYAYLHTFLLAPRPLSPAYDMCCLMSYRNRYSAITHIL